MSGLKIVTVNKKQHSFDGEEPVCGFLNRKHDVDSVGKRAKDRTWNLLWCSLKKNILELYKVDGILKQPDEPPPKDTMLSPAQEQQKHKIGFLDVLNASAEVDFTSQMDKDIQKRRKFLFRIILANGSQDLFQVSTELQRNYWVAMLNRVAIPHLPDEETDGSRPTLASLDSRLKSARCSVTRKTKHTVDSLTNLSAVPMMMMDSMDVEISPADLKLRLQTLKSLLHKKRELLKQLNRMTSCFNGDISSMYSESTQSPGPQKWTPSVPPLDEGKRFSIMTPSFSEDNSDSDNKRSSMEDSSDVSLIHHSASQYNDTTDCKAVETTLLSDFYLIPGAEWSLLKANETVHVIGVLPNGWYRCIAPRDVTPSVAISHERVDSTGDTSGFQDTLERPISMVTKSRPESEEFGMEQGFIEYSDPVANNGGSTAGSGQSQNDDDENVIEQMQHFTEDMPPRNTDRNISYRLATRRHHVDSTTVFDRDSKVHLSWSDSLPRNCVTSSIYGEGFALPGNSLPFDQPVEGNDPLAIFIASERSRLPPTLPLVGCLPPSVLAGFAHKSRDRFPPLPATTPQHRSSAPSPAPLDDSGVEDVPPFPEATTPMATSSPMAFSVSSSIPSIVSEFSVPFSVPANMGSELVPPSSVLEVSDVLCPTPVLHVTTSSTPDLLITSSTSMDSISKSIPSSASMDLAMPTTPKVITEMWSGDIPGDQRRSQLFSESTQQALMRPSKVALDWRKSSNNGGRDVKSPAREVGATPKGKGGANALDSKPSFLKKLFGKKKLLPPPLDNHTSRRSSSPSVLEGEMRPRLSSQSGQSVTMVGGAVLIGDSDTSDEEDGEEGISKDSSMKRSSSEHSNLTNTLQTEGSYKTLTEKRSLRVLLSPVDKTPSPLAKSHKSPSRNDSYIFDTLDSSKINSIFRTPTKGKRRKLTLPRNEPKYGFKLETYTARSNWAVEQTFVQSVNLGSPAFLAGLFAGDMIVEVDGVNVSRCPMEEVVKVFKAEKPGETIIHMTVVFVDGLSRLEVKKKADGLRKELRQKHQKLKGLLEKEKVCLSRDSVNTSMATPSVTTPMTTPPTNTSTASAERVCAAESPIKPDVYNKGWSVWEETVASTKPDGLSPYQYNGHLNKSIVLYPREINTLSCDVIVMPSSSCWNSAITAKQNNAMYQYLKRGGSGLWDELSLLKQGRLGDVMPTGGHGLPVQRIYHCLVGYSEDSAQLCVGEALRLARNEGHLTVALWVDGFAYAQVQPKVLVESVRHWLAEDGNASCFHRVIFSCSTFFSDTEVQVDYYFPHQWLDTQGDSDQSDSIFDDDSCSPKVTQDIPITTDNPLVTLATDQMKEQVQVQQFEIMPGALQSDV